MSTSPYDVPEHPREESPAERPGGTHPVNVGHLVMGVAFVGLVVVWALVTGDVVEIEHQGWMMGLPWLAAGAVGLVATVLRGPRHHDHHHDHHTSGTMHGWQ